MAETLSRGEENVEIVKRINANADVDLVHLVRDPDLAAAFAAAIAQFLHPDFECVRHDVPGGKPYIGTDGFREWWEDWLAPWVEYRTKINELIDCGERVLTLQHSFGRLEGSAHEVTLDLATLWTFRDGKVARWEVYPSHAAALKAVGLEEYAMSQQSTTPDPVELVQHLLDAAGHKDGNVFDGDVFARLFAPDALFLTGVGRFEGREAIRGYVEDFNSSYDEQSFAPDEVHDLGNGVAWFSAVVTGRLRGTSADVHLQFAVVVTHADGVVSQWTDYATIEEARAAAERLAEERG